jgi:succinyl-CoA synthetase beta subunit
MATMDTIKLFGARARELPRRRRRRDRRRRSPRRSRSCWQPEGEGILVNIFGGIMRCDTIAERHRRRGARDAHQVPLVVRMKGTNEELGRKILADPGCRSSPRDNMADAAQKIVAAAQGGDAQEHR